MFKKKSRSSALLTNSFLNLAPALTTLKTLALLVVFEFISVGCVTCTRKTRGRTYVKQNPRKPIQLLFFFSDAIALFFHMNRLKKKKKKQTWHQTMNAQHGGCTPLLYTPMAYFFLNFELRSRPSISIFLAPGITMIRLSSTHVWRVLIFKEGMESD